MIPDRIGLLSVSDEYSCPLTPRECGNIRSNGRSSTPVWPDSAPCRSFYFIRGCHLFAISIDIRYDNYRTKPRCNRQVQCGNLAIIWRRLWHSCRRRLDELQSLADVRLVLNDPAVRPAGGAAFAIFAMMNDRYAVGCASANVAYQPSTSWPKWRHRITAAAAAAAGQAADDTDAIKTMITFD